jgi:hypothetical protein
MRKKASFETNPGEISKRKMPRNKWQNSLKLLKANPTNAEI